MYRFAAGTIEDIMSLKDELTQLESMNRMSLFSNCKLPEGCVPPTSRLGIEKSGSNYTVYIEDNNIRFNCDNRMFMQLITTGELRFNSFDEMMSFLIGLEPLFKQKTETLYNKNEVKDMLNNRTNEDRKILESEDIAIPLKKEIFGQDRQIDSVSRILASSTWLEQDHPTTMMFMGPTGTGKTQCAEVLSKVLSEASGTNYDTIRINCNVFVQEHAVQSILGAPPSYIGYEDKTLLDPVRNNPFHVLIFDEIEKAHTSLITALMEAIDKGFLHLNNNKPDIDLRCCIMVFTSNIPVKSVSSARNRYEVCELCKDAFTRYCGRPEISSRISNYIIFDELDEEAIMNIVNKFIVDRLTKYNLTPVRIDERLIFDLTTVYLNNSAYGARTIRNNVEQCLSESKSLFEVIKKNKRKSVRVAVKGNLKDGITIEEA